MTRTLFRHHAEIGSMSIPRMLAIVNTSTLINFVTIFDPWSSPLSANLRICQPLPRWPSMDIRNYCRKIMTSFLKAIFWPWPMKISIDFISIFVFYVIFSRHQSVAFILILKRSIRIVLAALNFWKWQFSKIDIFTLEAWPKSDRSKVST